MRRTGREEYHERPGDHVARFGECEYCGRLFRPRESSARFCCKEHARLFDGVGKRPVLDETNIDRFIRLVRDDFDLVFKPKK